MKKSAKNSNSGSTTATSPVWCAHCCIRIAPYDQRTVYQGKDYHTDCHVKLHPTAIQEEAKERPKEEVAPRPLVPAANLVH